MLNILYQDDALVAIDKPSGLLVHRTGLDFHEHENALKQLRDQIGMHVYPVHRLDKATSGVLLFALTQKASVTLNVAFDEARVGKRYMAVVRGYLEGEEVIDHDLTNLDDPKNKPSKSAQSGYRGLRTIELPYPVGRYPTARYSLAELKPITGRRHQLRRHMKHVFHPIVGDTTYGDGKHNTFFRDQYEINRMLLHCRSMTIEHPVSGTPMTIECSPTGQFKQVLETFDWVREI
jgi:tRNA pseudouridine65 synthase